MIVKNGIEIARVSDPGVVFGELSFLLDQPIAADVRALDSSEFYVADRAAFVAQHSVTLDDIAKILTKRVDIANQLLIDLKTQFDTGISASNWKNHPEGPADTGASLVYAGYPYDPYALRYFLVHQINAACLLLSAR